MTQNQTKPRNGLTYRDAGVDIAKGNALVKAIAPLALSTRRPGAEAELGGFGGAFDPKAAGLNDPVLVSATDGVGTKLHIAFATGQHRTIGVDLVAMCVNDIIAQGASPLFFLDYFATGALEPDVAEQVIAGIAAGCREANCALIGGETAEMPGIYASGHYDLAGFAVGAAERGTMLPRDDVSPGNIVLGIASSGVHSNGFSLARRIVEVSGLDWDHKAPFSPQITLGEAFLEPTRIYVRPLLEAFSATGTIKALAHITGGGLTENLPRALPKGMSATLDLGKLPRRDIFGWMAEQGGVETSEMLLTFNCGIGMVVVVDENSADNVVRALTDAGEEVVSLGKVVTSQGNPEVIYAGAPWWGL